MTSPAALSRFTVLDLTRVRSGPTCVRQLADWGANVIKIEMPDRGEGGEGLGGPRNGSDFMNLHRNKRSMTLDLKTEEGVVLHDKDLRRLTGAARNIWDVPFDELRSLDRPSCMTCGWHFRSVHNFLASWLPSSESRRSLISSPPANPVNFPEAPITRWHGTMMEIGFFPFAAPTARMAFTFPICLAICP